MKYKKYTLCVVGFSFLFAGRFICPVPTTSLVRNDSALLKERFLKMLKKPQYKAFLDVISYAEGTYHEHARGYKLRYPYAKDKRAIFKSFRWHPGIREFINSRGEHRRASASGRYMILEKIWNAVALQLDLYDFSPLNQDLAALFLIWERNGAIEAIRDCDFKRAVKAVNGIWATLPGSPHRQVTVTMSTIEEFFKQRCREYKLREMRVREKRR